MLELSRPAGQRGFTLIEMSIVLVIIGLIIGGILKGQEIIESSRSKNVLAEVERIRAATNTFFDRYKALPGDFRFANPNISLAAEAVNGDGDGIIEPGSNTIDTEEEIVDADAGANNTENVAFFSHLALAKLVGGVTPSTASTRFGETGASPAAAFPGTGYTLAYGTYESGSTAPLTAHWLRISKGTPADLDNGLLPKQVQAIDVRIDDGIPANGGVRSAADGAQTAAEGCGALTTATAVDYTPTVEATNCIALFALVQ